MMAMMMALAEEAPAEAKTHADMGSGIMQADQSGCSKRNSISGSMKEKMKEIAKGMNPEKAMELAKKMGASPEALKKMETGMYKSRAVGMNTLAKDTLRQDIRENRVLAAREGEKLLGFLRFGREKKVSVLWQIAVAPDGRGKGIGSGLVQDWLVIERDEAAKFQLWVREHLQS